MTLTLSFRGKQQKDGSIILLANLIRNATETNGYILSFFTNFNTKEVSFVDLALPEH